MIPLLIVLLIVLFVTILTRRYQTQKRRRELFLMKRHAALYSDQNEDRLAG